MACETENNKELIVKKKKKAPRAGYIRIFLTTMYGDESHFMRLVRSNKRSARVKSMDDLFYHSHGIRI